jgi:hypothetical protein
VGAADDRPGLAEDADRDALVVAIETDGEHDCLSKLRNNRMASKQNRSCCDV